MSTTVVKRANGRRSQSAWQNLAASLNRVGRTYGRAAVYKEAHPISLAAYPHAVEMSKGEIERLDPLVKPAPVESA